jgi:hypothetical protein
MIPTVHSRNERGGQKSAREALDRDAKPYSRDGEACHQTRLYVGMMPNIRINQGEKESQAR